MVCNVIENALETIKTLFSLSKNNSKCDITCLRFNGSSVFDYSFMMSLNEKEYPKYLSLAYQHKFMQKLNLKHPKTINEKIQWLKIYDNLPIKTQLTDKVLVRDWIKDKIGEEYLKPSLWIGNSFSTIPFDILPEKIILKCNHGCKWHCIIKNKNNFLKNEKLFNFTKQQINGWLSETFFGWSDFETQYKNIKPQLMIEPYFTEEIKQLQIWCFNGKPQIIQKIWTNDNITSNVSTFDENYNFINLNFTRSKLINSEVEENIRKAVELSKILSKEFKFVRIDWMTTNNKLYFEEMTFTPFSGFIIFDDKYQDWNYKLGKMLNLKGI